MYSRVYSRRIEKVFQTFSNLNLEHSAIGVPPCYIKYVVNKQTCSLWSPSIYRYIHASSAFLSSENVTHQTKKLDSPNKFGTLSDEPASYFSGDEGDAAEDQYVSYPVSRSRKLFKSQYAAIIKEHLDKKEIAAAIDVVETRMAKEDRVKPDAFIYSLVINACGRNGLPKKAFQLYRKMLDRGLRIPAGVYTALFNACANSQNPEEGLRQATQLHSKLIEKGVELNQTHYHVMVKAFGRCGELSTAFQIVDLMLDKQIEINEETFNFLLHACITDKKSGFRYALLVWHKMLQKNMKPSIYTFNLLLRAVRDCGVGEPEEIKNTLQKLLISPSAPGIEQTVSSECLAISPNLELQLSNITSNDVVPTSVEDNFPDLLARQPRLGNFAASLDLTKPHQRMFLLGGSKGFLEHMKNYNIQPSIKTYTVLLDCIPPTIAAEKILLQKIKKSGLQLETAFCNMLIKRRSFRFDYFNAREVLIIMNRERLQPDLITFGVLALCCQNVEQAKELIRDMKKAGYRLNEEILGAMLHSGCIRHDFKYVMKILYILKEENLDFSSNFEERVNSLILSCKNVLAEERSGIQLSKSLQGKHFKSAFTAFLMKYRAWKDEIGVESKASVA